MSKGEEGGAAAAEVVVGKNIGNVREGTRRYQGEGQRLARTLDIY